MPLKHQSVEFTEKNYSHLQNLNLADSGANNDIYLFIGSDYYWDLVTGKVKTGKPGETVAIETLFGWILDGSVANMGLLILLATLIFQKVTYYFLIQLCHITLTI